MHQLRLEKADRRVVSAACYEYGMDIRVEREADGTLSIYESPPFMGLSTFVERGPVAEMILRYDVSGSIGSV